MGKLIVGVIWILFNMHSYLQGIDFFDKDNLILQFMMYVCFLCAWWIDRLFD